MAAALACAGAQAHAETFKWVDERGVVNYSNHPSPGKAGSSTIVEDRISTYQSPPLHAVALNRAPDYEWLQRQRIMAETAAAKAAVDCSYRVDCRDPYLASYGYPLVPVVVSRAIHRASPRTRAARASFH
jgi:Domain of unknown function (DUF4124)